MNSVISQFLLRKKHKGQQQDVCTFTLEYGILEFDLVALSILRFRFKAIRQVEGFCRQG